MVEAGFVTEGIELWLETGALVSGLVKDQDSAAPIPDVEVVAMNPAENGQAIGSDTTDETGRYEVRLPSGQSMFYLAAVPKGYTYPEKQAHRIIEVQNGKLVKGEIDFELSQNEKEVDWESKANLIGRVLDDRGNPVGKAVIMESREYMHGKQKISYGPTRLGVANQDGYFKVQVTAVGKHRILVGKKGYTAAIHEEWLRLKADEEMELPDLTISPANEWLEGVVLDQEGYPIADVSVTVGCKDCFPLDADARTDGNGRFRVEHLPNGTIHVWMTRSGLKHADFSVMSGGAYEFTLEPDVPEDASEVAN